MPYSYEIGLAFTGAGTAAITSGSKNVVGTGSNFDSAILPGSLLYLNGQYRVVDTIADSTHLAVTENFTSSASGLAVTGYKMYNLESALSVAAPKGVYLPYSTPLDLGSGALRGAGWIAAEWRWGYLTLAQVAQLRTFVPTPSRAVAIRTTVNVGDAYAYFVGQAIWPQTEDRDAGRRKNFILRFRALVGVA